jgi:recombination protein RecA
MFGNPETTTGGNALKFYASIRLDIRRRGSMNKDKEGVGISNNHKVKVIKNKLAPPYRVAEFSIKFGTGIDRYGEIVDIGAEMDIIEKAGSWYSYDGAKLSQGRENTIQMLEDNAELAKEIEAKIIENLEV